MFSVYDRCKNIIFKNDDGTLSCDEYSEIQDFDEYIIINTAVTLGNIERGWCGDVTFRLAGYDVDGKFENGYDAFEDITLKNVLCSAKTFNHYADSAVMFNYKFLKY